MLIDASGLLPNELRNLIEFRDQMLRDRQFQTDAQHLLNHGSEDDIIAWARRDLSIGRHSAIALATDYPTISSFQEVVPWSMRGHPRRPVRMKGSVYALETLWSAKSTHAEIVAERYLRLKRFTDLYGDADYTELSNLLYARFSSRVASNALEHVRYNRISTWINGERVRINNDEKKAVNAVLTVIKKVDRMDARYG